MPVINVLRAQYSIGPDKVGCSHTHCMMDIHAGFPAEGKCGVREVPSPPFQTKIGRARWMELDMVISAFIVECGLVMILVDVMWQIRDVARVKGQSLI